ncbi:MAG: UPF0262 family protein [Alphaproteobacteria bacterium]
MSDYRLSQITLDEASVVNRSRAIEQEREVAIYDLLDENLFRPEGSAGGPYHLTLGVEESRLILDVRQEDGSGQTRLTLSLAPLRKTVKDYFLVCDNYYKAIRTAPPYQIESLDMARRALHDEGARELQLRLAGKVETDFGTARRLFTLVCVLQMRG